MDFIIKPIKIYNKEVVGAELQQFESIFSYSFGEECFRIDHGDHYFGFFERLGEVHYFIVREKNSSEIAATGCGVLRKVPFSVWYLCDLKVHPKYRGNRLPLKILKNAFFFKYLRCQKAYAISMDNPNQKYNRVQKLLKNFFFLKQSYFTLNIYSMNTESIVNLTSLLIKHRGPISFLSLKGQKDLVLEGTALRIPLLHVQFGFCAQQGLEEPSPGYTYLFCSPAEDPLTKDLSLRQIQPSATATVIHTGMSNQEWRFILTSDI